MPVLSRFWKWTLIVAGFNMLVAFAGQWLLWGGKSSFLYIHPELFFYGPAEQKQRSLPTPAPTSVLEVWWEKVPHGRSRFSRLRLAGPLSVVRAVLEER